MVQVTTEAVKALREETGAGIMDCRRALSESDGDVNKAKAYLREKGLAAAAKKGERETSQGVVESYIHGGGRIGALVELNWPNAAALSVTWEWNVSSTTKPRSATRAAGRSSRVSERVPHRSAAFCQVASVPGTPRQKFNRRPVDCCSVHNRAP